MEADGQDSSEPPIPEVDHSDRVESAGEDMEADGFVTKRAAYGLRSSSSQSRDRQTIKGAAHNDREAVLSTGAKMFSEEGNKAASTVVKRVNADPSLGEPLLKCLKKMEADLEQTRVTPIASLAYLLGLLPCSRSYYHQFILRYYLGNQENNFNNFLNFGKVENILKGSLDLIPSPSPSVKIQIMGWKVYSR